MIPRVQQVMKQARERRSAVAYIRMLNRRELIASTFAAGASAVFAKGFTKPLGVQLYTVRSIMPKAAKETIDAIAKIGYKEAEVLIPASVPVLGMLKDAGINAISGHFPNTLLTGKPDPMITWENQIENAQKYGVKYFVVAYIAPPDRGKDLDFYRKFADKMNHGAELCSKAGLRFCYHNHAFEFGPLQGSSAWQVLMERCDKKVGVEMDVFWVSVAGQDPIAMLKKHPGRFPLLHLKDKAKGAPVQFNEGVDRGTFKEVGNGAIDFKALLAAAQKAKVEHYIVEQDQTPGDPVDSLRQSYTYLRKLA